MVPLEQNHWDRVYKPCLNVWKCGENIYSAKLIFFNSNNIK